jgi:class I fructose-bisphosphate aldolase
VTTLPPRRRSSSRPPRPQAARTSYAPVDAKTFLSQLYDQIHIGGASGNATGRNIHQRSLDEAVRLTKAISAITIGDMTVDEALAVFNGEADFKL